MTGAGAPLAAFFETMGPFLRGEIPIGEVERRLGPLPCAQADLAFYAELVAFDQRRILAEMFPAAHHWIEQLGGDWTALVSAFLTDHPPAGWSVPHVGEGFADWIAERSPREPWLPPGIEAVVDLAWTRFRVRTAPDGPSVEVRHYPIDAVGVTRALLRREALPVGSPTTLVVFRHVETHDVHHVSASLETIAVLVAERGEQLPPPLDRVTAEALAGERRKLVARGVFRGAAAATGLPPTAEAAPVSDARVTRTASQEDACRLPSR